MGNTGYLRDSSPMVLCYQDMLPQLSVIISKPIVLHQMSLLSEGKACLSPSPPCLMIAPFSCSIVLYACTDVELWSDNTRKHVGRGGERRYQYTDLG